MCPVMFELTDPIRNVGDLAFEDTCSIRSWPIAVFAFSFFAKANALIAFWPVAVAFLGNFNFRYFPIRSRIHSRFSLSCQCSINDIRSDSNRRLLTDKQRRLDHEASTQEVLEGSL